jgi:hypothetical protein
VGDWKLVPGARGVIGIAKHRFLTDLVEPFSPFVDCGNAEALALKFLF